jgi:hypothetical protein
MLSLSNLTKNKGVWAAILALLIALLATSDFGRGPAAVRSAETKWDRLTILYHSDCKGKIEPCG